MEDNYDNSSITASLEDFEHDRSPRFKPSLSHSEFRSEESEAESDRSSAPWSPPAWRKQSSGWLRHHRFPPPGASISHSTSPLYESAGEGDDTLLPTKIPLPPSPPKESPMDRYSRDTPCEVPDFPQPYGGAQSVPEKDRESSLAPEIQGNYIRFAMRAEVQHRTDSYESATLWLRDMWRSIFQSWTSIFITFSVAFMSWSLMQSLLSAPKHVPTPDMLKATQIARTFEPLIHYAESGSQHIAEIQDTSIALWDLGESVRTSNLGSAQAITDLLNGLSDNFKDLTMALTSFFSNVEGDVDSILIVIDWSKRSLLTISTPEAGTIASVLENVHGMLSHSGLLETAKGPTLLGTGLRMLVGESTSHRNAATLQRTFDEFLNSLDEAIDNELQLSVKLFSDFESIEKQLENTQRLVVREIDEQSRGEEEVLSSLWQRVLGNQSYRLRRFEKNKDLLSKVRRTSVQNKHLLSDHNGKLLQLKSNLEVLRRRIVSPLMRSNDSSVLSLKDQIDGLENTYEHLKTVREKQRQRKVDSLWESLNKRTTIGTETVREIER